MSRSLFKLTSATLLVLPLNALSAHASEGDVAAEGGGGALPQFDSSTFASQIFWLLIFFFLFYWLCATIFLPRIGGILEERRNRIANDMDQAADFKRQAGEAEKAYNLSLAEAKARAAQIAADTKSSLDAEIAEMEAETDKALEADISAAEQRIAETAIKAATGVREAAADTTKALVMALIDETPADDAVEAALSQIGA